MKTYTGSYRLPLIEPVTSANIFRDFFAGDLAKFEVRRSVRTGGRQRPLMASEIIATVDALGESIDPRECRV